MGFEDKFLTGIALVLSEAGETGWVSDVDAGVIAGVRCCWCRSECTGTREHLV